MLLLCGVEEILVLFSVSFRAERSPARATVLDLVCLVGSPGKVLKFLKFRHDLHQFPLDLWGQYSVTDFFFKEPQLTQLGQPRLTAIKLVAYDSASTLYRKTYETTMQSRK